MNFTDTLSEFQFRDSVIKKAVINNDFTVLPDNNELEYSVKIQNGLSDIINENNILSARLILKINLSLVHKETEQKMLIEFIIDGVFTFSRNDEEQFKEMLLLNGNSTLYSIARANIINLTSMCLSSGKVVLPMINFLKLMQLKEKEDKKTK